MNDPNVNLKEALKVSGGAAALAAITGYSRARVYQWISEGHKNLPPLAAYRFINATTAD